MKDEPPGGWTVAGIKCLQAQGIRGLEHERIGDNREQARANTRRESLFPRRQATLGGGGVRLGLQADGTTDNNQKPHHQNNCGCCVGYHDPSQAGLRLVVTGVYLGPHFSTQNGVYFI